MVTPTLSSAQIAQVAALQGQINALIAAIGSGVTRVSYDGRSVEYDDLQSMKMRVNYLKDQIAAIEMTGARKPQVGRVLFQNPYQYRPYGYRFRNL